MSRIPCLPIRSFALALCVVLCAARAGRAQLVEEDQNIITVAGALPGAVAANPALLSSPRDVAVFRQGDDLTLYVADAQRHRVLKIDSRGNVSTFAGTTDVPASLSGAQGDGGPATAALLNQPAGLAVDANGNVYIAEVGGNRVRMVSAAGIISRVAGTGAAGYNGDNQPATSAQLRAPAAVTLDSAGSVIIADRDNNLVRQVAGGTITTIVGQIVAGVPQKGSSADGTLATAARLSGPAGVAFNGSGDLYVADRGNQLVRVVDHATNKIATIAGQLGKGGYAGDGGPATAATLFGPSRPAIDADGNVYIADRDNNRIRRVDAVTKVISTTAGGGSPPDGVGDNGLASDAQLAAPVGINIDRGDFYIADRDHNRIRRVTRGIIGTIAVGVGAADVGDGGPAILAQFNAALWLTIDERGDLYIGDALQARIRYVNLEDQAVTIPGIRNADGTPVTVGPGDVTTVVGTGLSGETGDGGPALAATVATGLSPAFVATGRLAFCDSPAIGPTPGRGGIRLVNLTESGVTVLGIAIAPGTVQTIVPTRGPADPFLDDVSAVQSDPQHPTKFVNFPTALLFDEERNLLFFGDNQDHVVRVVNLDEARTASVCGTTVAPGHLKTIAGTNPGVAFTPRFPGDQGDGLPATAANLEGALGIAFGRDMSLIIGDPNNLNYRVVDDQTGLIATLAGRGLPGGFAGDGGPAISAAFSDDGLFGSNRSGVLFPAYDGIGVWLVDRGNSRLRFVDTSDEPVETVAGILQPGEITTLVGDGGIALGADGDGGAASKAQLVDPFGIFFDRAKNLYITDPELPNSRIRRLDVQAKSEFVRIPEDATLIEALVTLSSATHDIGDYKPGSLKLRIVDRASGEVQLPPHAVVNDLVAAGVLHAQFLRADVESSPDVVLRLEGQLQENPDRLYGRYFSADMLRIAWDDPPAITYGTALTSAQLDAMASVPGTFTYAPPSGTVPNAGAGQALKAHFQADDPRLGAADWSVRIDVSKATPTIAWSNPDGIVYGTALAETQLDATASVPGTFAYTPAAGTVLGAGSGQTLSVVFTPTDSTNYTSASATVSIDVSRAALTIQANDASKTYGQTFAFAGTEFTTAGLVNGDTVSAVTLASPGAVASAAVSGPPYAITASNAVGTGLSNYTLSYVSGALTVNPALLTVTANDSAKILDEPNPAFTASYGGFENGETLATSGVTGAPSLTTPATTASGVGSYPIVAALGTLAATNYTFGFANGTLTVTYGICPLYDPTKMVKSGATLPVKLYLCDFNSTDVSSAAVVLQATGVTLASTDTSGVLAVVGDTDPDLDFRFDPTLGPTGGYIFNLRTSGLGTGTWVLSFNASGDPVAHTVSFQVR
jgi:hypothetical protein